MFKIICFASIAAFAALNVPLEVLNWADLARTGEPITAGVPLPQKAVTDLTKLRITDASGNTVPAQFKWLSKWWQDSLADGNSPSIKWVLCDFQADVAAKNKTAVFLKDDNSVAPTTALSVLEASDAITVTTGPLKFIVSKTHFNLFDQAWLDADDNGAFETSERIFAAGNASGGIITAGDWSAGGCVSGTEHAGSLNAPDRFVVEENGPMKVLIRVEGRHYAAANGVSRGLYGWQCFITAYAGKAYVDVQWALTNNLLTGDKPREKGGASIITDYIWPFTSYKLSLAASLNASATQSYSLLSDTEVPGTASDTPARLLQKVGSFTVTGGTAGTAAKGGASLSDGALGLRVVSRDFSPNAPKAVSVSKGRIDLEFLPDTTGSAPYQLDALTRDNNRLRIEFFSGAPASGALASLWTKNDAPLRMLATDRAWYRDTRAWERVFGIPYEAQYARRSPGTWTRMAKPANTTWQDYGQMGEFNGGGDHWNLTSCFWNYVLTGNPEDFEYAEKCALWFNDRVQCQFSYDVWSQLDWFLDPIEHKPEYRYCHEMWGSGADPVDSAFPGYTLAADIAETHGPDAGHMTQLQEIEYYLLTGDPATRDAMEGLAVHAAGFVYGRIYLLPASYGWSYPVKGDSADMDSVYAMPWGPRYIARPSMVCNHAYEVTGDYRYFYPAKLGAYCLRNVIRRHPIGYLAIEGNATYCDTGDTPWAADHPGVPHPTYFAGSDFQIGIGMEALYSFLVKTGDEEVRDALIEAGASMLWRMSQDSLNRWSGFMYGGWCDYGFSGKRYPISWSLNSNEQGGRGYYSSMSEGFGGFIFSYLASGRTDYLPVLKDGWDACGHTLGDMKIINLYEAMYRRDSLDAVPPATVADLAASDDPVTGLRLTWTAPGNNGTTGRAARYQVKFSTTPLCDMPERWNASTLKGWPDLNDSLPYTTEALLAKATNFTRSQQLSFWAAPNLENEPAPQNAGASESFTLTGLDTSVTYYFALVAYDSAGNVSGISNVVTAKGAAVEKNGKGRCLFALSGNEPNPFNPSTVVRFSLAQKGAVTLAVYDIHGRIARTLAAGEMEKGAHRAVWDGRDDAGRPVATGIYFTRLISGDRVLQRKMALVK